MINYQKILNQNIRNVLKDILKQIEKDGISGNNQLYITFSTIDKRVKIPKWLKEKYPSEMTIIIQYEFYNLKVNENNFCITLSFSDINTELKIDYNSVISIADPVANFGLKFNEDSKIKTKKENNLKIKNNIISFSNYKKK